LKKFILFISILSSFSSCQTEDDQVICHEINRHWNFTGLYHNDSLELDITGDENIDFSFYLFSVYGSGGSSSSRSIKAKNGFEIAKVYASSTFWVYDEYMYPDTSFSNYNFVVPQKMSEGDTIVNDTVYTADRIIFISTSGNGSMPPDPFEHGSSTTNPWITSGESFIAFKNQSLGILGWIKIDLYGSVTIIRSHYKQGDTLVIDDSICQ